MVGFLFAVSIGLIVEKYNSTDFPKDPGYNVYGIYVVCDTRTGNLIYSSSSGLAIVQNGCTKTK